MQSALPSAETPAASRQVRPPIIQECVVHYECRILHKNDVVPGALVQAILDDAYARIEQSRRCPEDQLAMGAPVQFFLRATNITDARRYFADLAQGMLPFPTEEPTE
jgi:hypothetical protein